MIINIHFLIILVISIITFIADILIYTFSLNYLCAIFISVVFSIGTLIFIKSKSIIKIEANFHKLDLIFMALLLFVFIIRIFIPDQTYDVNMYHIYLQENPFMDKIKFDFFPGRTLNSFLFPLGDRMFFLFRYALGYRLGTILSYYAFLVLYYQAKRLINNIIGFESKLSPILASLIFFINIIYLFVGSYYIDILSTVFILEVIILAFSEKNFLKNRRVLYASFLISGIATGIKVSNLILIFPIYVYILIKNYKDFKALKIKDFIVSIFLFMIPFIIYVIDNIKQTGSPLFPYYNNIFMSDWFEKISWQDSRFGIPNWLYAFIWPIEVVLNPIKTCDFELKDYIWGIGYIIIVVYIMLSIIFKSFKKESKIFELSILTFFMSIIWAMLLMGYVRYAYILPILYIVIMSAIFITKVTETKSHDIKAVYIMILAIIIFMITSPFLNDVSYFVHNFNTYLQYAISKNTLFWDRATDKIHIDGAWVAIGDDSKLVTLVREEGTPIYNFDNRFLNSEQALEKKEQLTTENLYTLIDESNAVKKKQFLKDNNLEIIEEVETIYLDFLPKDEKVTVYKLKYCF